jgi:hypothetical protein
MKSSPEDQSESQVQNGDISSATTKPVLTEFHHAQLMRGAVYRSHYTGYILNAPRKSISLDIEALEISYRSYSQSYITFCLEPIVMVKLCLYLILQVV